ncbi:MAG: hypothetical protein V2J62_02710 [candidate division KSB1 bacterium]|jgi:maltose/maltodextrin transport system substrate-binding protein|nr:hypothetical protein [candidate division KSB1 bacterium]
MNQKFTELALNESVKPIHPGRPGHIPFWNIHARRAIYAPVFYNELGANADHYVYSLVSEKGSTTYQFEAECPWAALTPVWKDVSAGRLSLTVQGMDRSGNRIPSAFTEKVFLKSSSFRGVTNRASYGYDESGMRCLKALLYEDTFQTWLRTGKPNPEYPLWVHPSKIVGAVIAGMSFYANATTDSSEAAMSREIALRAGDFLLSLREPEGRPLEFWTHSYWDGVPRGNHPIYMTQIMTNYPAEAALAFFDLYDATGETRFYEAGYRIALTYRNRQREDGTWPQLLDIRTGESVKNFLLIPVMVIKLFDRMISQYDMHDFADARERAFQWCMVNPMKTYNWQGQFEDTRPKSAYQNMSRAEAVEMVVYLLDEVNDHPEYLELGLELLRFAEDQFVVWNQDDPVLFTNWFKEGSHWNGNDPDNGKDWFLPCVLEQYKFYTPISRSNSTMMLAHLKAWEVTSENIYLAKAVALANTITNAQAFHGGGVIPTHLRKTLPELNWLNCAVYPAMTLIRNAGKLNRYSASK